MRARAIKDRAIRSADVRIREFMYTTPNRIMSIEIMDIMNIEDISTQAATWPVELILRNAVNFSSLEFVADWWRERSAELFSFEAQKIHSTAVENSSVCRIL